MTSTEHIRRHAQLTDIRRHAQLTGLADLVERIEQEYPLLLAGLFERVQSEHPRLFAICGVYEDPPVCAGEDPTYVEWGLEFPHQGGAIAWSPGSLTKSGSAAQILSGNAKMGPAKLVWLD